MPNCTRWHPYQGTATAPLSYLGLNTKLVTPTKKIQMINNLLNLYALLYPFSPSYIYYFV